MGSSPTAANFAGRLAPLPDGYYSLTPDEKKRARLNAIFTAKEPEEVVASWQFFRSYYLDSMADGRFYKRKVASPQLHYEWVYAMAKYARNFIAAPRSFAKSIVIGKEWPLYLALSRPGIEIIIVVSEQKKAIRRGQDFIRVIKENKAIKEDFGDLCGSPRRDGRPWSFQSLGFANGSTIHITSMGSIHLGDRPDVLIWDDIEPDPQLFKEAWEQIVDDLVSSLFNVFLPMLDAGTQMVVVGTLLHRRSFLYWAMHSNDVRLGFWNRILSAIIDPAGNPTWPEKFDADTIRRLRQELGPAAFSAQYMNAPMSDEDCVLQLHERRTSYEIEEPDEALGRSPLDSRARITYWESDNKTALPTDPSWRASTSLYGEFVGRMTRFIAVDFAEGSTDLSDYSVVTVLGLDGKDNLWVLDMWIGRPTLHALCNTIWHMAYKWHVHVLGIEAIGVYQTIYQWIVAQRSTMEKKMGWIPRIKKVQYPAHLSKPVRIAALEWRFNEGRIKIPNRHDGVWQMLKYQIENFTPNLKNLRHDDALDTVSMHPYIINAKVDHLPSAMHDQARVTFAERLAKGQLIDKETGIPYITGMNADQIPYHSLMPKGEATLEEKITVGLDAVYTAADLARELAKRREEFDDGTDDTD